MDIPDSKNVASSIDVIKRGVFNPAIEKRLITTKPILFWTIMALVEYRKLQDWAGAIVTERLGGDLEMIGSRGYLGHPKKFKGIVPGLEEWEFYFHGRGCAFTHRMDGQVIDVDFIEGKTETLDLFFFQIYAYSLKAPKTTWFYLALPKPLNEACGATLRQLETLGWVTNSRIFKLSDLCYALHDRVEPLLNLMNEKALAGEMTAASQVAWLLNDPYLAARLDPTNEGLRTSAAVEVRDRIQQFWASPKDEEDVYTLALLDRDVVERPLTAFLEKESRPRSVRAVYEVIRFWRTTDWNDRIHASIRRVGSNDPYTLLEAARLLVKIHNPEHWETLSRLLPLVNDSAAGQAALFLYRINKEKGLNKLRECLESPIPICRYTAAATLAVINTEESKDRLLAGMLKEICRVECCTAIMEMNDAGLREEARRLSAFWWPPAPPSENDTFADRSALSSMTYVRAEINAIKQGFAQLL